MKNLILAALLLINGATIAQTWTADKVHSSIGFTATHMVVAETSGSFKDYEITVNSPTDDFFNAEKYPEVKFSGKLVKKGKKYSLDGKLTLRGTTRDVTFPVIYKGTISTAQFTKAGFTITGAINRFDYGLKWDKALEAGGLVVGKDVTLVINVELNKSK